MNLPSTFAATLLLCLPVAGCGGAQPAEHPPADHEGHEGKGHHGKGHHGEGHHGKGHHGEGHHGKGHHGEGHGKLEGALGAFHDVLAPIYHAEKGPGRADKACAGTASLKSGAEKVAAEPKGDPEAWKTLSATLAKTLGDLDAACKGDKAGVEPALEKAHDAFHALMDKAKAP